MTISLPLVDALCKMAQLRVRLKDPRNLEKPLLSDRKVEKSSYMGRAMASVFISLLVSLGRCAACEVFMMWPQTHATVSSNFVFYRIMFYNGRDSWFYPFGICLLGGKDKETVACAGSIVQTQRFQSIGRIMRRTDLRE